ncbi:MAG TPA: cobalamin biosynthesis protein [Thermodesulfobacteriota bacterium]|nr:cobalamin biosynthesis protein [Thermodesulfobacteriota bacterium]
MRIAIIAITEMGDKTAQELAVSIKDSEVHFLSEPHALRRTVEKIFNQHEGLIFIMALGIVIRVIAPFIKSKHTDPAVVVVDENRRFAISALSGHEGGANRLANQVASILHAEAVITTASETMKHLIVGVGCRKGTGQEEILEAIDRALKQCEGSREDIRCIATIDLKGDEPGLIEACLHLGLPLKIVPKDHIKSFNGPYQRSSFVKEKIGVEGVSEPCALLAGRRTRLIVPKLKQGKVCVAIAREG